jgi:hypothetical protein
MVTYEIMIFYWNKHGMLNNKRAKHWQCEHYNLFLLFQLVLDPFD